VAGVSPQNDCHMLRRYGKRWHIERLFTSLHCFRRRVLG